jgi:hypothetical protein
MAKPIGEQAFTLKAILIWTINDFPAYGLVSRQQTKGYKGCPICGEQTCVEHSLALRKMVYLGSRRFLPRDHRLCRVAVAFNGQLEGRDRPMRRSGAEILQQGRD